MGLCFVTALALGPFLATPAIAQTDKPAKGSSKKPSKDDSRKPSVPSKPDVISPAKNLNSATKSLRKKAVIAAAAAAGSVLVNRSLKDRGEVSDLADLVDSTDPEVAGSAREALDKMAVEAGGRIRGADPDSKVELLDMIEEMGPSGHGAVADLVSALGDENEVVRQEAADALAAVATGDDADAIAGLMAAMTDDSADVRDAASRALAKMGAR